MNIVELTNKQYKEAFIAVAVGAIAKPIIQAVGSKGIQAVTGAGEGMGMSAAKNFIKNEAVDVVKGGIKGAVLSAAKDNAIPLLRAATGKGIQLSNRGSTSFIPPDKQIESPTKSMLRG